MQKKKGVSLIVLVITIIVMTILAGAIVLTLNNSGIIDRASEAVDKTNEATVLEVAQLGWAEAYTEYGADKVKLEEGVKNALTRNNIDPEDYVIKVTTNGVTIKSKKSVWVKQGFTVVKGDQVLEIGDIVNYDETAGGTKTGLTDVEWKVLGADEDGNLLIMAASDVKTGHILGDQTRENLKEAQNDWLNGAAELDGICEPYGYGKGTIGKARSITVEDVNAVKGFDPNTYGSRIN